MPLLLAAVLLIQDPGTDRVYTSGGEEVLGAITTVEANGGLVVKTKGGTRTIPLDDIRRLQFEEKPAIAAEKIADRLWPRYGGSLTGSIKSIDADRVTFQCSHGTYAFRRDEVRALTFTEPRTAAVGELKEDQDNVLLAPEAGKTGASSTVSGIVESISAESIRIGGADHPRERLREIRFKAVAGRPLAAGLFARVQMKNGDGLVGMLRSFEAGRLRLFTHYAGVVAIEKSAIHSIAVVPAARFQAGNMILISQNGVTEIDRKGQVVWNYASETVGAMSARKLPNGNVLVANPNYGKVLELRPVGSSSAEVAWSLEGINYPCDAQKLPNGNVLVAEYGMQQIVEYDPKDRSNKGSFRVQGGVIAIEPLADGTTLASLTQGTVMELDAKGAVRHRYSVPGQNEYRATSTPDGTILVADQRGVQVIEMDRKGAIVWKFETPQPRMAIRLDDGCTLILTRRGEVLEIDPDGKSRTIFTPARGGGAIPVSFSTY